MPLANPIASTRWLADQSIWDYLHPIFEKSGHLLIEKRSDQVFGFVMTNGSYRVKQRKCCLYSSKMRVTVRLDPITPTVDIG